jgi:hypothetical protein
MKRLLNRKNGNISKMQPADSFSVFEYQCAARTGFEFDMPDL